MDSRIRLDYALFQLTPTRTRCDLVICAGDYKEKLASGLLEPYVSHLKFAKDEMLKGGYSITLSAPASASWFTKSTLERFVRFVSTPEVLERFVTIETEIKNIDCSINNNASSSDSQSIYGLDEHFSKSGSFAYKHEDNTSDTLHEQDPKFHLQRVLETRKAALQREQAMVYARALVAGFDTDILQDLICFADAFGSPRLREACLSFIELCNTKSDDSVWMDEVAAMQAYSRSQFAYMEDDLGQELRINVPNSNFATNKQNVSVDGISNESHVPQYMHSYQGGPMFHPAYQGYPFPYYQGNHPWPPYVEDSRNRGRRSRKKRSQDFTQDGGNFDSSDTSSGSDSGNYKRSSKKKVIIKNINYITSTKNEESEHESDATHESQKVTQQWNIFQNLLMKDVDDKESVEEYVSHKFEDPNTIPSGNQPEFTTVSSTIGKHEEKDWYMRSRPDKEIQERSRDIFEDHIEVLESTKDVLVEYPVQDRSLNEYDSQFKTHDSFMIPESDLTHTKVESARVNEPNDLHMVLERDAASQQVVPAWTPEMESGSSNSKIVKMDPPEVNKSKTKVLVQKGLEKKGSAIEAKSKTLVGSRRKTPTATKAPILKGRTEKEEEKRKRVEELLTQRQKRIAERSASTAKTAKNNKPKAQLTTKNDKPKAQPTAKNDKPKVQLPMKNDKPKAQLPTKNDKPKAQQTAKNDKPKVQQTPNNDTQKAQYASRDMKSSNKRVIRSSTIDRLAAARVVNPKVISTKPKPDNKPMKPLTKKYGEPKPVHKPTKVTTNENGVSRTLLSQKAAGAETKKAKPDKLKPVDKNIVSKNSYGTKKKTVDHNKPKQLPKASEIKKTGDGAADIGSSTPAYSDHTKSVSETLQNKTSLVVQKDITVSNTNGGPSSKAVSFKISEDINEGKKNHIAKVKHGSHVMESSSSKKKWSTLETSSKALSGFKKLLSFGRRS